MGDLFHCGNIVLLESPAKGRRRACRSDDGQAGMSGALVEIKTRILFLQAEAEGIHADYAAGRSGYGGIDVLSFLEHFRE